MEQLTSENLLLLIVFGGLIIVLIAWLIYRNQKDEEEFEENMSDPKRDFHKEHEGEGM